VLDVIGTALGGEMVPTMDGAMIPLGQLAKVVVAKGAPGIRTENALLSAYIYVDIRDRDIGGYVADAKKAVAAQVKFPPGYYLVAIEGTTAPPSLLDRQKLALERYRNVIGYLQLRSVPVNKPSWLASGEALNALVNRWRLKRGLES
jgi:hypothetical protein